LRDTLNRIQSDLGEKIPAVSIRGGEPTRHPEISSLIRVVSLFSNAVFLETHGRWILTDSDASAELLSACQEVRAIVKISFDRMHGKMDLPLREITDKLDGIGVEYAIAITEFTQDEFRETRGACDWVPNSKIIFQQKAKTINELMMPKIGVVRINGSLSHSLTARVRQELPQTSATVAAEVVA
jgi:organic radical activating enzyme